jgi:putative ABC transport system permease protein
MNLFSSLRQDVRWSLHVMRRNLGLTVAIVLSLGLAIGAVTAIFSVLDAFLLRPLAIADIDRVVRVRENGAAPGHEPEVRSLLGANYGPWAADQRVFTGIAAASRTNLTLTGNGSAERFPATRVSANFFPLLGIKPLLGRNFSADEDRPGQGQVVLISYDVWQTRFSGDPKILGRTLMLNGDRYAVIGVLPRGLHHPYESDMWVPLGYRYDPANVAEYYAPARLRPGVTIERARREMNDLAKRLYEANPRPQTPRGADLSPMRGELVGDLDQLLYLLTAAAAFVLLIAAVNTSNLLLAQGLKQTTEVALRVALGATRRRLVQQILTYSVLLALFGGLLGLLLAGWAMKPLVALSPAYGLGEFDIEPRLDLPTLAFGIGAALLVGVLFGLVPALRMSRGTLSSSLQEGGRTRTLGTAGRRLLGALVVAEVALSMMLLVGAGLVMRSFQRMQGEYRGFDFHHVLSFTVPFPDFEFKDRPQKVAFVKAALDRLRELPGVTAVGGVTVQPLYTGTYAAGMSVEGKPASEERGFHVLHNRIVTPGYLESLRVPLVAGRFFDDHDTPSSPWVVVVSKSVADRYWPGESAVGKRIKRGAYTSTRPWLTVVGVAGTLKETHDALLTNDDAWYLPYSQPIIDDLDFLTFMLRTPGDPALLAAPARRAIEQVDKNEPIYSVMTMDERFAERMTPVRFSATIYTSFGILGLVLAGIGIYGVLAFSVNQRLREIGIRAAMGAQPAQIRRLVVGSALRLTMIGLGIGLAGALLLSKFLASQLYQVSPRDPLILFLALLFLALIGLLSSYLPARRAEQVDPVAALRYE